MVHRTDSTSATKGSLDPFSREAALAAAHQPRQAAWLLEDPATGRRGVSLEPSRSGRALGTLPGIYPEWLGDGRFVAMHGLRFPYVAGAMASGIASEDLVIAMARGGMLGFFGAAGLPPARIEQALDRIAQALAGTGLPWGANLIHSPNEPAIEEVVADLYLQHGVERVSASAYMALTRPLVRYASTGLSVEGDRIRRRHHVFAKLSRPEVARRFLSPAPAEILDALVARGELTADEARLARRVPVADQVTVEADSGGHTDNRPLPALFPTIRALRDDLARKHEYDRPIFLGAAGGLGTPTAVAAAFALGAAYVLTGSVNHASLESGQSAPAKALLADADLADVTMAPSSDMFELGVKVQVLRRGTLYGARAGQLYDIYRSCEGLHAIPADVRERLEKQVFQRPLDDVWADTRSFWESRDPEQVARAERDPRHKMALTFRWYLGLSSRWAIGGVAERRMDYQLWCGPAMGAFNAWVRGSFLEDPAERAATQIALNLLEGATVVTRAQQLRSLGLDVPEAAFAFPPRRLAT